MATITLDAILYTGEAWDVPQGERRPTGDDAAALYDMGFRQHQVYEPKYGAKSVLTQPGGSGRSTQIPPGTTIVHDNGQLLGTLAGDRTTKPKPPPAKKATKKATKAKAKKATKKAA